MSNLLLTLCICFIFPFQLYIKLCGMKKFTLNPLMFSAPMSSTCHDLSLIQFSQKLWQTFNFTLIWISAQSNFTWLMGGRNGLIHATFHRIVCASGHQDWYKVRFCLTASISNFEHKLHEGVFNEMEMETNWRSNSVLN